MQNRSKYFLKAGRGGTCLKFYYCTSHFKPEVLLFDERLSIESGTQSVEAVMGLAVGHSLQSVFAKATNTKQRKKNPSDQSYRT